MKKNANGSYSPRTAISTSNPQAKEDGDWWDEVCKAHGEKNHWKKEEKKKTPKKKDGPKNGSKFYNSLGKTKKKN